MKAYSCLGASLLSVILISASPGLAQSPPHSNGAPLVDIVTPRDGSMFLAPVDIPICAVTAYFTDTVASVEFFAGTNSLGVAAKSPVGLGGSEPYREPGSYHCLVWTNVPPGAYSLTATAKDLAGNTLTSAAVDISVVTNLPPRVSLTKPRGGAMILGPTNINLCATAFDPDHGTVTQVEFFEGPTSLGVVTNVPVLYITNQHGVFPINNTSYCLTWDDVKPGAYTLTAVATDNDGAKTTSEPVDISVVTNVPPRVRLVSPNDGATYFAPGVVTICAAASDPYGTVTAVEFFAGAKILGVVTNHTVVTNQDSVYDQFCFTWSGVVSGAYTLTAVATDNSGTTGTSAPVRITVVPPPPPTVEITTDGELFLAPADIWICSVTRHFPDRVASVQYFAGTTSLGIATNWPSFCFRWTKVPPGAYALTATARDLAGTSTITSPPVDITVTTNRPPSRRR